MSQRLSANGSNGSVANGHRPRLTREPPARVEPDRRVARALKGNLKKKTANGAPKQNVVDDIVATAYKVCEEYVRQGREAARLFDNLSAGGSDMYQDITRKTCEYWADMAKLWWGAWFAFMPGMGGRARFDNCGPRFDFGADPCDDGARSYARTGRITVQVMGRSNRISSIEVDLKPNCVSDRIYVKSLRHKDDDDHKLEGLEVTMEDGRKVIVKQADVPAGQKAGKYMGFLCDRDTRSEVGTIYVTVD